MLTPLSRRHPKDRCAPHAALIFPAAQASPLADCGCRCRPGRRSRPGARRGHRRAGWFRRCRIHLRGRGVHRCGGVGSIVADTYRNLRDDLAEDATVNLRAVEYPARAVPQGADRQAWSGFLASVSEGADAAERLITDTIEECGEDATIVVAGYSQGAMAMHRALEALGPTGQIVTGVPIGDGDKMADDNVRGLPEYGTVSSEGIAQVAKGVGIRSGATDALLPEEWASVIIDACADGDVVCAPDSLSLRSLDAHQSYDAEDWRVELLGLVSG
ncbi:MAG TPA: hypothetical protein DCL06_12745 [Corynebacterium variabile]|uniref:Cutinase family protein n=1 Tax=Corynebacterium variabile TaxID=1727 RepID=A0A3B9QXW6_9CORY|nr:hypothetical protein [Corynebacterium variabile]